MTRGEFDNCMTQGLAKIGAEVVSVDSDADIFDTTYELYRDLPVECLEIAIMSEWQEKRDNYLINPFN